MKAIKMLVLVLLFTCIPLQSVLAAGEKTLDSYFPMDENFYDHWAYEEMSDLINADIIDGYVDSDGLMYVRPGQDITRAQFVKIIVSALGLTSDGPGKKFNDIKSNHWYSESIRIASDLGIIHGNTKNQFNPDHSITRAEITKIIVLAFENTIDFSKNKGKTFTDVHSKSWAYDYINKASGANIVMGYGSDFRPTTHATRAQAMVMIHRALQQEKSSLPDDAVLSTLLKEYITSENDFIEAKDVNKLAALYQKNTTGFYKAEKMMAADWIPDEPEDGTIMKWNDENLKLTVIEKSNRFATVKATGMTLYIKVDTPNYKMELTEKIDTQYNLKKDPKSGEWKIYDYLPIFDEEVIMSALNGGKPVEK